MRAQMLFLHATFDARPAWLHLQAIGIAPMLRYWCSLIYLLTLQKGKTDEPCGISCCAAALCQNPPSGFPVGWLTCSLVPHMSMGLDGSFCQRQFQNQKKQQSWFLGIIHNDNPLKLKPVASLAALLSVPATFTVDLVTVNFCCILMYHDVPVFCVCLFVCLFVLFWFGLVWVGLFVCLFVCLFVFVTYFWATFSYNFMNTCPFWIFVAFAQLLWGYDRACSSQQRCHQYQARPDGLTPRKLKIVTCAGGKCHSMVDARRDKWGLSGPLSLMFGKLPRVTLTGPWLLEMVTIGLSMVCHSESAGQASR